SAFARMPRSSWSGARASPIDPARASSRGFVFVIDVLYSEPSPGGTFASDGEEPSASDLMNRTFVRRAEGPKPTRQRIERYGSLGRPDRLSLVGSSLPGCARVSSGSRCLAAPER